MCRGGKQNVVGASRDGASLHASGRRVVLDKRWPPGMEFVTGGRRSMDERASESAMADGDDASAVGRKPSPSNAPSTLNESSVNLSLTLFPSLSRLEGMRSRTSRAGPQNAEESDSET